MAEMQDEEQWLYGDDKGDSNAAEKENVSESVSSEAQQPQIEFEDSSNTNPEVSIAEGPETNGEIVETNEKEPGTEEVTEESQDAEQNGDKSKDDGGDDSSSDDEPTVTIGKIVKQPDIMRPPPPTHRAAPTSGLKDEDFNNVGKINGVPATDFNLAELEEKPWRKPGADLSDYFNYGFTEETWIKYCERQKSMRVNESGIGLAGLGVNIGKGMLGSSNIPVSIVNENSKYGGIGLRKPAGVPIVKQSLDDMTPPPVSNTQPVNTIQVMTADRRSYSNKVLAGSGPGFGGNPYGNDYFNTPPPSNYYNTPPPGPWGGIPNVPPPGWGPDTLGPPPVLPPHRGGSYFEEDSVGSAGNFPVVRIKEEKDVEKVREPRESRSRTRSRSRERERDRERERESRHHSSRRRSRSRSKSRHKKRSRSRSRSPSHRHKRKRSKRERELD